MKADAASIEDRNVVERKYSGARGTIEASLSEVGNTTGLQPTFDAMMTHVASRGFRPTRRRYGSRLQYTGLDQALSDLGRVLRPGQS